MGRRIGEMAVNKLEQTLKQLMFNSFREYLESELWRTIKNKTNRHCKLCGKEAVVLRFKKFTMQALQGIDSEALIGLCQKHQYYGINENGKIKRRSPYVARDAILRGLGFQSYKIYLKSDLWKKIREAILTKIGYKCRVCGCFTRTLHHTVYNEDVFLGFEIKSLVPLCNKHHKFIEFNQDIRKTTLPQANVKLGGKIERRCRFCRCKMYTNDVCAACKRKHATFLLDEQHAYRT